MLYKYYEDKDYGPSRHLTIVFNVFVLMQIVNMICARKIDDEINIFEGIHHNMTFIIIIIAVTIIQVILVQFTQDVFMCSRDGLDWHQWLI
jgi:heme/copper-type cytochrome/quinol oxidase subunit 2